MVRLMTDIKLQKFLAYVLVRLETISHCWFRTMLEQSSSPLRSEFLAPHSISPCKLTSAFRALYLGSILPQKTVPHGKHSSSCFDANCTTQLHLLHVIYFFTESQTFAHLHLTFTLEDAAINHKFGEFLEFACFCKWVLQV